MLFCYALLAMLPACFIAMIYRVCLALITIEKAISVTLPGVYSVRLDKKDLRFASFSDRALGNCSLTRIHSLKPSGFCPLSPMLIFKKSDFVSVSIVTASDSIRVPLNYPGINSKNWSSAGLLSLRIARSKLCGTAII